MCAAGWSAELLCLLPINTQSPLCELKLALKFMRGEEKENLSGISVRTMRIFL